jgi:hypothetical protein
MSCEQYKSHKCTDCVSDKLIKVREKKASRSTFILSNPSGKEICRVEYDGCFNTNNNQDKCDFLLLDCEGRSAYFVELKGSNFTKALSQIQATLDREKAKLIGFKLEARVVLSKFRAPNYQNDSRYVRLRKALRRTGGDLKKQSVKLQEQI